MHELLWRQILPRESHKLYTVQRHHLWRWYRLDQLHQLPFWSLFVCSGRGKSCGLFQLRCRPVLARGLIDVLLVLGWQVRRQHGDQLVLRLRGRQLLRCGGDGLHYLSGFDLSVEHGRNKLRWVPCRRSVIGGLDGVVELRMRRRQVRRGRRRRMLELCRRKVLGGIGKFVHPVPCRLLPVKRCRRGLELLGLRGWEVFRC